MNSDTARHDTILTPEGENLDIPPEGLVLSLSMPVACELISAELQLSASLDTKPLDCTVSSDQGTVDTYPKDNISWLVADWHTEYLITALEIKLTDNSKVKGRIQIFQNNAWLPLSPSSIIATGSKQYFPLVIASKVMVEFVTESQTPGLWDVTPAKVKGITVYATLTPYNMSLAIGEGTSFFSYPGALPGPDPVQVTGIEQAVNKYLAESDNVTVPLKIKASMPAKVNVGNFKAETIFVARTLEGVDQTGHLELPWSEEAIIKTPVGARKEIKTVQFSYSTELVQERLFLTPPSTESALAHLCDPEHSAAQCFSTLPEGTALAGLDIYLRPAQFPLKAEVSFYPDDMGRPGGNPYLGISIPLELNEEAEGTWQPRWVACQLTKPLLLDKENWWVVFHVETGEAHWRLGANQSEYVLEAMYRIGRGPWLKRISRDSDQSLKSLVRLRTATESSGSVKLSLRRNSSEVFLQEDTSGWVSVDQEALKPLNQGDAAGKELVLVVTSNAAGTITFIEPFIRYT